MKKILLLSIHYPLTMARYFENALRAMGDEVELKTCGWFTGNWIPWQGGMTLDAKYSNKPDYVLGGTESIGREVLYPQVERLMGDWKPDMVLNVDAGIRWIAKPNVSVPVVHVATDPHCLNYDKPRAYSDFFFNMQKFYSKPDDIYLPYAYDDTWCYPDVGDEFQYDISLIGMPYTNRVNLVNKLRLANYKVYFNNREIFDEYRKICNVSRIGLNWSSLEDLNCRVFEIMGMGQVPVINRVPDLPEHFIEGEHYFGFSSEAEAMEKVEWGMEEDAVKVAWKAQDLVKSKHTFKHRVKQIMETVWK